MFLCSLDKQLGKRQLRYLEKPFKKVTLIELIIFYTFPIYIQINQR